jgi:hypothetical protein
VGLIHKRPDSSRPEIESFFGGTIPGKSFRKPCRLLILGNPDHIVAVQGQCLYIRNPRQNKKPRCPESPYYISQNQLMV